MEELVRQLVAALEEMQSISQMEREMLGESRGLVRGEGAASPFAPDYMASTLRRMRDHFERTQESLRANTRTQRLDLHIFRLLRDLSRDEATRRTADLVWDLMEERKAINISDWEERFQMPEPPEMEPSVENDDPRITDFVERLRFAIRDGNSSRMLTDEALIDRREELLAQALAEARSMLGEGPR